MCLAERLLTGVAGQLGKGVVDLEKHLCVQGRHAGGDRSSVKGLGKALLALVKLLVTCLEFLRALHQLPRALVDLLFQRLIKGLEFLNQTFPLRVGLPLSSAVAQDFGKAVRGFLVVKSGHYPTSVEAAAVSTQVPAFVHSFAVAASRLTFPLGCASFPVFGGKDKVTLSQHLFLAEAEDTLGTFAPGADETFLAKVKMA